MRDAMGGVLALVLLVWLVGCTVRVYSPPSGTFPVESSASLGQGQSSVRGDIFWGGEMFGPTVVSYRVSAAHGLTDKLDLSLAPALIRIVDHSSGGRENRNIYAARAGIKYAPVPHFALVGGLGGGGSAGGGFLSPDLGFIAAYDNPYVIPFFALRGLLSAPVNAKVVRFTTDDDADSSDQDNERDVYTIAPRFTWGWQTSLGLRALLARPGQLRALPALACAIGFTDLYDKRHGANNATYSGVSCAVDVTF